MPNSSRSPRSRRHWGMVLGFLCLLSLLAVGSVAVYSQGSGIDLAPGVLRSAEKKYGVGARRRLENWQWLMNSARNKAESDKLQLINDFFNQIPFVSDQEHWGKNDFWATPVEMLASNGGDCEDFAIGKYFTLLALDVPIEKLKIAYVQTRDTNPINRSHTVLTYYSSVDAVPLVLDNLLPEIRPATERNDLIPVYAFNGAGLWLAKEHGEGRRVSGGSGNISLWRELTARMGKEFD